MVPLLQMVLSSVQIFVAQPTLQGASSQTFGLEPAFSYHFGFVQEHVVSAGSTAGTAPIFLPFIDALAIQPAEHKELVLASKGL